MYWFNLTARKNYENEIKQLASGTKTSTTSQILKPRGRGYKLLTPDTPLEELSKFLMQETILPLLQVVTVTWYTV